MNKKTNNSDALASSVFVLEYLDDAELESSDVTGCGGRTMDIYGGNGPGDTGWP